MPKPGAVSTRLTWAFLIGSFVFAITVLMRDRVLATQDLYLHIATGRWILAHNAVPDHDIFSNSVPGAPWVAHEWLAAVLYAFLYDHLGWGGVLAITAVAMAAAIAALTCFLGPRLGYGAAIVVALFSWGLCLNHLTARPNSLVLPLVAVWIASHAAARQSDSAPSFKTAPLMWLWANLHGSFLFGLAFTALFAVEAVFESKSRQQASTALLRWTCFGSLAGLLACITPYGFATLLFPVHLVGMSDALANIYEWLPSSLENNAPLFFWLLLLLFFVLLVGVKARMFRLCMFLLLLYMAFAHRRHTELLALAAPILLGDDIAHALRNLVPQWPAKTAALSQSAIANVLAIGAIVVAASVYLRCLNLPERTDRFTPAAAVNAAVEERLSGPVLNAQIFGGYLIMRGYKPFVDGRVDMYGGPFMRRFADLHQLPQMLKDYNITWAIFEPANPRLALMPWLPGWKRLYADDKAVIYVRGTTAPQ